jgi:hypothetical protein
MFWRFPRSQERVSYGIKAVIRRARELALVAVKRFTVVYLTSIVK